MRRIKQGRRHNIATQTSFQPTSKLSWTPLGYEFQTCVYLKHVLHTYKNISYNRNGEKK